MWPCRHVPVECVRGCEHYSFMAAAVSDLFYPSMIDGPSWSRKIGENFLIVKAAACDHCLRKCNFPVLKLVLRVTCGHGPLLSRVRANEISNLNMSAAAPIKVAADR